MVKLRLVGNDNWRGSSVGYQKTVFVAWWELVRHYGLRWLAGETSVGGPKGCAGCHDGCCRWWLLLFRC